MFFYVNGYTKLLPEVQPHLHLDQGWNEYKFKETILYWKGYLNQGNLEDELLNIYFGSKPAGIWTVIEYKPDRQSVVYTPNFRGCPLYAHNNELTNIYHEGYILISSTIKMLAFDNKKETISLDQAATQILDILRQNIKNILKYNKLPIKVIFSGGIDSLLLLTIVDSLTQDYELHCHIAEIHELEFGKTLPFEEAFKRFFEIKREYNNELIDLITKKYWGYKLTSITHKPMACITGFWGDEIMLRNPDQINCLATLKHTDAKSLVKPEDYMYNYINNYEFNHIPDTLVDNSSVFERIIDFLSNDFQMWHLDNHIHYSPYFDIKILEVMMKLSLEDQLQQGTTAILQKKMVELVNPLFSKLCCDYKNTELTWENFRLNKHTIPNLTDKIKNW